MFSSLSLLFPSLSLTHFRGSKTVILFEKKKKIVNQSDGEWYYISAAIFSTTSKPNKGQARQNIKERWLRGEGEPSILFPNPHMSFSFVDHCWMESNQTTLEQPNEHDIQSCREWDVGDSSFCASFMTRNQDISFGAESPTCDAQSPTFTCRSSFSSFLVESSTPCSASGGFSFHDVGGSTGLEFSSPVSSMPSFAFLSPNSVVEKRSCTLEISTDTSNIKTITEGLCLVSHLVVLFTVSLTLESEIFSRLAEASMGKLLLLPDSTLSFGPDDKKLNRKPVETKRAGGTNGHRVLGIHSKRNRTIGLGEREQLDLVVTESVIRWSSCTQLPTSLRSSLVC